MNKDIKFRYTSSFAAGHEVEIFVGDYLSPIEIQWMPEGPSVVSTDNWALIHYLLILLAPFNETPNPLQVIDHLLLIGAQDISERQSIEQSNSLKLLL